MLTSRFRGRGSGVKAVSVDLRGGREGGGGVIAMIYA